MHPGSEAARDPHSRVLITRNEVVAVQHFAADGVVVTTVDDDTERVRQFDRAGSISPDVVPFDSREIRIDRDAGAALAPASRDQITIRRILTADNHSVSGVDEDSFTVRAVNQGSGNIDANEVTREDVATAVFNVDIVVFEMIDDQPLEGTAVVRKQLETVARAVNNLRAVDFNSQDRIITMI